VFSQRRLARSFLFR
jgi:hypothetical protein